MALFETYQDLKGYQWAKDVIEGRFLANKYVKLECQRYVDRLEKLQYEDDFDYYFDLEEANIVFGLTSLLVFPTGFYAGKNITLDKLAGFQAMVIECIFCFKSKELNEYGTRTRLIEEVYLEIGRKSGKSFLTALIEILILLRSPSFAQHGIGGLTRDVSSLVKQATIELIKSSPAISKYFKITREKILCTLNEATMKNFSGDANTNNGLLLSSYIVDETGCLPNNDLVGVLKLSQMSLTAGASPLAIYISTQYDMPFSIFNEMIDYHKKVLQDLIPDAPQTTFGLLFELDEEDYPNYHDPKLWQKASPLQALESNPVGMKFLKDEFSKAIEIPAKLKEFQIKILNMRVTSSTAETFVAIEDLRKGRLDEPFDFRNKDVYWGVDLSLSGDTTSISMVHYDKIKDEFYVKSWVFIPEDTVFERSKIEKIDYRQMERNGYCFACGDRIVSYKFIEDKLLEFTNKYQVNVKGIGYDKYNAMSSVNRWHDEGLEVIEVRQHSTVLNGGTKKMKESILQNKFFYDQNRLFEIQMSNARTMYDTNLNQYIHKKKSSGKIDSIAATLNAFVLWNKEIEDGTSVYEERDFIIL